MVPVIRMQADFIDQYLEKEYLVLAIVRTLIHIGLPRTASTFLQTEVFPKIEGFEFYGVEKCYYSEPFQKLLYQDDSLYVTQTRTELIGKSASNVFLSNELLSGHSLSMNSGNRSRIAQRLKEVVPEGEIILILRNQVAILESLYSMAVYSGYCGKPEEFVRFENENQRYDPYSINEHVESFLYSPLIQTYREHFEKVHVFLFEDFAKDPIQFAEDLAKSLDLTFEEAVSSQQKRNKSLSRRQISYFRKVNRAKSLLEWNGLGRRIFRQKIWFGEKILKGKTKFQFSDGLKQSLESYYKDDNEKLSQMYGLDQSQSYSQNYRF